MRIGIGWLGDATCPSVEQLQGIVDFNDPCQSDVANLPLSTAPANAVAAAPTPNSLALQAATVPQSSNTILYVGVAAAATLLLISMMRR